MVCLPPIAFEATYTWSTTDMPITADQISPTKRRSLEESRSSVDRQVRAAPDYPQPYTTGGLGETRPLFFRTMEYALRWPARDLLDIFQGVYEMSGGTLPVVLQATYDFSASDEWCPAILLEQPGVCNPNNTGTTIPVPEYVNPFSAVPSRTHSIPADSRHKAMYSSISTLTPTYPPTP